MAQSEIITGRTDIVQVQPRLTLRDLLYACLIGLAAFLTVKLVTPSVMDPSQWSEAAVAAGLKPAQHIFPGFWRAVAAGSFKLFGIPGTVAALSWIGALVAGFCAGAIYCVMRVAMSFLARMSNHQPVWYDRILPGFAAFAAAMTVFSDAFLDAAQTFSPEQFRFLLLVVALLLYVRWLTEGSRIRLWCLTILLGLLAAETPFAFILPVLMLWGFRASWGMVVADLHEPPETLDDPDTLPRWRMFFLFVAALAAGICANVKMFEFLGGLDANGWTLREAFIRYEIGYARMVFWASSMSGWMMGLGFCVFPAVVIYFLLPKTLRDDVPMPFATGAILVFVAFLALLQCGAIPYTRFWGYAGSFAPVESGFLLMVYALCTAAALAMAGAVFASECQMHFLPEEAPKPGWRLRYLVAAIAVAALVSTASRISRPAEREMAAIVNDAIEEIIRECAKVKWLFTDGRIDDGIRLAAAAAGKDLTPLSMFSSPSRYDEAVRTAPFPKDSADRDCAAIGIPALFRVWAAEKPNGMDEAAIQLGFDMWRRAGKPLPKVSGLVALPAGLDDAEADEGAKAAEKLAERIFAFLKNSAGTMPTPALNMAFDTIQWRIARMAFVRENRELAESLDNTNRTLRRNIDLLEQERKRTFMQLTPREGLMLALHRADFVDARRYAAAVLRNNPDDPDANFATGMGYIADDDLQNAEIFLRKVLAAHPEDPAVLNNLAVIACKTGRFEEGEALARKALEKLPDSPEVRQTLQDAINRAK